MSNYTYKDAAQEAAEVTNPSEAKFLMQAYGNRYAELLQEERRQSLEKKQALFPAGWTRRRR